MVSARASAKAIYDDMNVEAVLKQLQVPELSLAQPLVRMSLRSFTFPRSKILSRHNPNLDYKRLDYKQGVSGSSGAVF